MIDVDVFRRIGEDVEVVEVRRQPVQQALPVEHVERDLDTGIALDESARAGAARNTCRSWSPRCAGAGAGRTHPGEPLLDLADLARRCPGTAA